MDCRAEELRLRTEKAEKYAHKAQKVMEAMRSHREAAKRHEVAAQQVLQPNGSHSEGQSTVMLRAQLEEAEGAVAAMSARAKNLQVPSLLRVDCP